jgi:protein SCO1/2
MATGPADPRPRPLPRPLLVALVVAALVFVAAGAFLAVGLRDGPRGAARTWLGSAIGGPFDLVDQNGKRVTDTDLRGTWLLLYFGYTHCPDACPTALSNIALALHQLDAAQRAVLRPVFITIDPARDTPQVLKDYVASFDAPILALTGTAAAVAQAAKAYHVYYAPRAEPGGDYSLDHTSLIYVIDRNGRFAAGLPGDAAPAGIAERLKQLLGLR